MKTKKMQKGGIKQTSKPNPSNSAQMDRGVSKPRTTQIPASQMQTTKMQRGGVYGRPNAALNPTGKKTAMNALGIKSNKYSAGNFNNGFLGKDGIQKPKKQKGGSFVEKANQWLDKNFRDPINEAGEKINKYLDKNVRNPVNRYADKKLRNPASKLISKVNKSLDKNFRDPINAALHGKKRVVKKTVKVTPKSGIKKSGVKKS